jgi:SAM-dependent methyltransferase
MSNSFEKYADFYDKLYVDKDYASEVDYVSQVIQNHQPGAKTILEFGSGTGIHGRLLGESGYSVIGIEPSETMLSKSTETTNFKNFKGDIREAIAQTGPFDVCLVLFHVFNYLTSFDDQLKAFKNIHSKLDSGGLLALEVWHGPAVEFQKPEVRQKTVLGDFGEIVRIAVPTEISRDRVDVTYHIFHAEKGSDSYKKYSEIHSLSPSYPDQIAKLASLSGFEVLTSQEFATSNPPTRDTWSVLYLLRSI